MPAGKKEERNSACKPATAGRLKCRRRIDQLFKSGKRVSGGHVSVIFSKAEQDGSTLAVFVPKRLGNAVHRNRARRAIREHLRQNPHPALDGRDVIILCRRPVNEEFIRGAREEVPRLLDRITGERSKCSRN